MITVRENGWAKCFFICIFLSIGFCFSHTDTVNAFNYGECKKKLENLAEPLRSVQKIFVTMMPA